MKDCTCKEKETTTQCTPNPCDFVYKMPVDGCTNKTVYYITLASAVLMSCNDEETVEHVLNLIRSDLTDLNYITNDSAWQTLINKITAYLKTHLAELDPQLREYVNNLITEYFDNIDFDSLNTLFTNLFTDWKAHLDSLLESIAGSIQFDNTPTLGSNNAVTSDGIAKSLNNLEQPDWNETDSNKHSFIKNKPNILDQYPNAIHVFQEFPNQLDIEQIYVKCYSVYQYNFLKYHIDDKTDPNDLGMVISVLLGLYLDDLDQRTTLDNASFGLVPVSTLQDNWNRIDPNHEINYSLITIDNVAYYKLPIIPRTILLIRETLSRGETLDVILVNRCLNELLGKSFTGFNIMEIKNVVYVDENGVLHNIALKDNNTYYDVEHGCYVHVYSENGSLYIKFISQPINVPEEAIMDTMDLNDIDYLYSLGMQVYLVHKFSDISNVKIHLNARNSSSIYGTTLLGSYLFHVEVNNNGAVVKKYTVNDVEDCETGGSCVPVPDPTIN